MRWTWVRFLLLVRETKARATQAKSYQGKGTNGRDKHPQPDKGHGAKETKVPRPSSKDIVRLGTSEAINSLTVVQTQVGALSAPLVPQPAGLRFSLVQGAELLDSRGA